jgi:hypothetical protein
MIAASARRSPCITNSPGCPNYFDRQLRVTTDLCIASATVASKPSGPAPPHAPHAARLCEPRINSPPGLVLCEWWIANKKPRRSGASSIRENRAAVLPAPRQYRGHTEESLRWPFKLCKEVMGNNRKCQYLDFDPSCSRAVVSPCPSPSRAHR